MMLFGTRYYANETDDDFRLEKISKRLKKKTRMISSKTRLSRGTKRARHLLATVLPTAFWLIPVLQMNERHSFARCPGASHVVASGRPALHTRATLPLLRPCSW
jgi:hypothetical protein